MIEIIRTLDDTTEGGLALMEASMIQAEFGRPDATPSPEQLAERAIAAHEQLLDQIHEALIFPDETKLLGGMSRAVANALEHAVSDELETMMGAGFPVRAPRQMARYQTRAIDQLLRTCALEAPEQVIPLVEAVASWKGIDDLEPWRLLTVAALVRAEAMAPGQNITARGSMSALLDLRDEQLKWFHAEETAYHRSGDQHERHLHDLGVAAPYEHVPVCEDLDTALAQARALVNRPWIACSEFKLLEGESPHRLQAHVVVESTVMQTLIERIEGAGGQCDLILLSQFDGAASKTRELRVDTRVRGGAERFGEVRPMLGLRLSRRDGDREQEVVFTTPLGEPAEARAASVLQREGTARAVRAFGDRCAGLSSGRQNLRHWDGHLVSAIGISGVPESAGDGVSLGVFAAERCDHHGASWDAVPQRALRAKVLVLSCPRCLRRQAASVPVQSIPDPAQRDQLALGQEKRLLGAERRRRALSGEPDFHGSWEDLVAHSPVASLDPADYAVTPRSQQTRTATTVRESLRRGSR